MVGCSCTLGDRSSGFFRIIQFPLVNFHRICDRHRQNLCLLSLQIDKHWPSHYEKHNCGSIDQWRTEVHQLVAGNYTGVVSHFRSVKVNSSSVLTTKITSITDCSLPVCFTCRKPGTSTRRQAWASFVLFHSQSYPSRRAAVGVMG